MLPSISALNFTLDSPSSVEVESEFTVSIQSESVSDNYDVKIFVENPNASPKTISRIYNEEWQNSYFYINSVFPEQTEFKIKILSSGDWEICARLRKGEIHGPQCNPITVTGNTQEDNQQSEKEDRDNGLENEETLKSSVSSNTIKEENPAINEQEKIILNPSASSESNQESKIFLTNEGNFRLIIIYAFTVFCIIIIILLALRKL